MAAESEEKQVQAQAAETTEGAETNLLDACISATPLEREEAKDLIANLVENAMKGTVKWDKSVTRTINKGIAAIDAAMSKQLAAIMHHDRFAKLEGTWRGLETLVMNTRTGTEIKLRVMQCSKDDLKKDLFEAVEFDQSHFFKAIYTAEYDMPGGKPYGAIIGDFEFTNHPEDVDLLKKVSGVAAAGFCPFISAASPELFGFQQGWEDLPKIRDLAKIFDSPKYASWQSFRESEDSRFVVLTMPRVLARLPYGKATKKVEEFEYEEVATGPNGELIKVPNNQFCWMNSAYVYGTILTDSFFWTGWCTRIRGAEGGGKIFDLPAYTFQDDAGDLEMQCPSEVAITERRENELSTLGFLPLCHYKNTDYAVFFGGQTAQKAKTYEGPDGIQATENAKISARLPYILAASRIAHYLKVIARDKIGSFMERTDCEDWLNDWIHNYVLADEKPDQEMKAKYPLAAARIDVSEVPGDPGHYRAVCYLRPWLQFEQLTASLRMVTNIPARDQ